MAPEFQSEYASEIVAVKLNNVIRDLQTPLNGENTAEFIELSSPEGWRIYRRSVSFLLFLAVHRLDPKAEVTVKFRANSGLYCEVNFPGRTFDAALTEEIERVMRDLVRENIPIYRETVPKDKAVEIFREREQTAKAELIADLNKDTVSIYRAENYYDYLYGAMLGSTGSLGQFVLDHYATGVLLRTPDERSHGQIPIFRHQPKLSSVLSDAKRWGSILHCPFLSDLNRHIRAGDIGELIRVSEALQEKQIAEIAAYIAARRDKIRLVLIAGPSSSGKTSFAQRLRIQLRANGAEPVSLSLDDYYVNRLDTPKNERGEYDFECLESIDLALFNDHLAALLRGEAKETPHYNFLTGMREWRQDNLLKVRQDQPIIVEGIHGLNERLTATVPRDNKCKIYVSALTQLNIDDHNRIPTTEARLLRRLVRDNRSRGAGALKTLKQWPDVRAGEEKYIFPFQEEADVMFNSALVYELAALNRYAVPLLESVSADVPEYSRARRLLDFCKFFLPLPDEGEVPNNSLLREFIGGSVFFRPTRLI
ncbi:MAG: nucleoside kinase [Selenomonadaceae bacterium]|nr:nucleoside kinase [Selenomonadaceae bacterium]